MTLVCKILYVDGINDPHPKAYKIYYVTFEGIEIILSGFASVQEINNSSSELQISMLHTQKKVCYTQNLH